MARPKKIGLDYFPLDVDIFTDRKIRKLIKRHGLEGYVVFNFILCEIYRDKGYYVQYDTDFIFDVSDSLNIDENKVTEIILFCVSSDIFNKRIFDWNKRLTSEKIQGIYVTGKRNKVPIEESMRVIVTETKVNDTQTNLISQISTQSKVKESKVKESKVKDIPVFDVFKNFALQKKGDLTLDPEKIRLKYESWVANDWKTGNEKPIKNWKSTLLNTLVYLQKEKNSAQKEKNEPNFDGKKIEYNEDY